MRIQQHRGWRQLLLAGNTFIHGIVDVLSANRKLVPQSGITTGMVRRLKPLEGVEVM